MPPRGLRRAWNGAADRRLTRPQGPLSAASAPAVLRISPDLHTI